jgi:hypothetical protein
MDYTLNKVGNFITLDHNSGASTTVQLDEAVRHTERSLFDNEAKSVIVREASFSSLYYSVEYLGRKKEEELPIFQMVQLFIEIEYYKRSPGVALMQSFEKTGLYPDLKSKYFKINDGGLGFDPDWDNLPF